MENNREIDCNQERIEGRVRTKRGSKIINVGVSLLTAQMNSDTDFSVEENLIDIPRNLFFCCDSMCWIPDYVTAM